MRRLHLARLGVAALVAAGCAPEHVDVGAYETRVAPLAHVLPASRFRAHADLLEVGGDGLPEAVRDARRAVRDSVEGFMLSLAPEAIPDSVETDVVTVTGQTDRLYVSDAVYSTLVTISVRSGDGDGATVYLPVTVDLTRGAAVRLGDLFAAGTPWRDALAGAVRTAALASAPGADAAQVPERYEALVGGAPAFTLGAGALVLHVPPRRLTSDALHAEIAYSALAPYAPPGGLLRRLGAAPRGGPD